MASAAPQITRIQRLLIAVPDLDEARRRWTAAGFSVGAIAAGDGISLASLAAGAISIDLCSAAPQARSHGIGEMISAAAEKGGGVLGWIWGCQSLNGKAPADVALDLPGCGAPIPASRTALSGVLTGFTLDARSFEQARGSLAESLGNNSNTVTYLDHLVVMAPDLEAEKERYTLQGLECRRIREVGGGVRQAFFKLEQTIIELVAPSPRTGCWGLAFMCADVGAAVTTARAKGLQATEPKVAVQGGKIARLVDPLDGVSIAFMELPAPG